MKERLLVTSVSIKLSTSMKTTERQKNCPTVVFIQYT
jgi:hypothetical protein